MKLSPLEAYMQLSLFGSTYVRLAADGAPAPLAGEEAYFRAASKGPWVADASGFNVHTGVTVRSGDREGVERSCRYCARPEGGLERLSKLPDGHVASAYFECADAIANGTSPLPDGCLAPVQTAKGDSCQ